MSVSRRSGRANANGIPGRPAPLPMSAIRSSVSQQFRDRGAIQYVAVPQPVHLAGSEQAPRSTPGARPGFPRTAERDPSSIRRGPRRPRGRRGHLHMFHVKHPPDLAGRNGQPRHELHRM